MGVESQLDMKEQVENKDRRFGSNLYYFPCEVTVMDGTVKHALFTESQLLNAIERAERNPEDIPEDKSFWDFLGF